MAVSRRMDEGGPLTGRLSGTKCITAGGGLHVCWRSIGRRLVVDRVMAGGSALHGCGGLHGRLWDAHGSADACLSQQKVQGLEANRRRHRLTEPTTKALCQPPPLPRHSHPCQLPSHHPPLPGGESRMQLLPMASSPDGLISAPYAVITKPFQQLSSNAAFFCTRAKLTNIRDDDQLLTPKREHDEWTLRTDGRPTTAQRCLVTATREGARGAGGTPIHAKKFRGGNLGTQTENRHFPRRIVPSRNAPPPPPPTGMHQKGRDLRGGPSRS